MKKATIFLWAALVAGCGSSQPQPAADSNLKTGDRSAQKHTHVRIVPLHTPSGTPAGTSP